MKRLPFELSREKTERQINNLLAFNKTAMTMLSAENPDVHKPYWDRVVADNCIRLQSLKNYAYLLHLRT